MRTKSEIHIATSKGRNKRLRPSWWQPGQAVLLAGLSCSVSNLSAQSTNSATAVVLEQVTQRMGQVETVFTRFVQERHLSLFQDPLRSEGYLCFKRPGCVRWEITQPYQSILISDGRGVAQFERIKGQWKKLELGLAEAMQHVVSQIGAIMAGRYAGKQGDYSVSATQGVEGPVVTLTPQQPVLRKMMLAIEIHLAPDCRGTRRILLREVGGDFTDIRFSEQVAGPKLPPETFDRSRPTDLEQIQRAIQPSKGITTGGTTPP